MVLNFTNLMYTEIPRVQRRRCPKRWPAAGARTCGRGEELHGLQN